MFYHFYWCLASILSVVHSDLFIFDKLNVIRITLKVPSIRNILSIGSVNGKNRLSKGHPRFILIFPSVNRQIKSVVRSLRPVQLCIQ